LVNKFISKPIAYDQPDKQWGGH